LAYLLARDDYYYTGFEDFSDKYRYPRIVPATSETADVKRKLAAHGMPAGARLFVINPNTSPELAPEARKWPAERYGDLARRILAENEEGCVVFIGTTGEREYVQRVAATAKDPRVFSTAGELGLRELLALFTMSQCIVSNDSGPMHLACLTETPVVGLFFADT